MWTFSPPPFFCNTLNPQLGGGGNWKLNNVQSEKKIKCQSCSPACWCYKATLWEDETMFLASQDGNTTSAAIPHTIQNVTFASFTMKCRNNKISILFFFFQPPADYKTKGGGIVVFLSVALIFNGPQGFHCLTTQCSNSNMTVAQIGGSKTTTITLMADKGCHFF